MEAKLHLFSWSGYPWSQVDDDIVPDRTQVLALFNAVNEGSREELVEELAKNSIAILERGYFGNEILCHLFDACMLNQSIQVLELGAADMGVDGAKALGSMLAANCPPCLRSLHLAENQGVGDEGMVAIAKGLEANVCVTSFGCQSCGFGNRGMDALGAMLAVNTTLRLLNPGDNQVHGIGSVATGLESNTTLQVLFLYGNSADADDCDRFARMLAGNTSLLTLHLDAREVGDKAIAAIANGLQCNQTLQRLVLRCQIEDQGILALAEMMAVNHTLSHLTVRGTNEPIGKEGSLQLVHGLAENRGLQSVALHIDDHLVADELWKAVETNRGVTKVKAWGPHELPCTTHNAEAARQMHAAVEEGHVDSVRQWLQWGVHVDCNGDMTPLERAIRNGDDAMVTLLHTHHANPFFVTGKWGVTCAMDVALEAGWRKPWHWMWPAALDEALETALLMNSEERNVLFDVGDHTAYSATANWWTLPDEVMDRVVAWMCR